MSGADDDLKAAVQRLEAAVQRLEPAVASLQADSARQAATLAEHSETLAEHNEKLDALGRTAEETLTMLRSLNTSTTSMASAVTQAIAQLARFDSHERRLERLEAAVFPPKH